MYLLNKSFGICGMFAVSTKRGSTVMHTSFHIRHSQTPGTHKSLPSCPATQNIVPVIDKIGCSIYKPDYFSGSKRQF